jgi:Amt family ammonium transporter
MPEINSGDTAWMLTAAALVMFMTRPGFFYAGFTRSKNVLGTIMHSFIMLGVITLQFVIIGFSLAFGPDQGGVIGNLDFGFDDVGITLPRHPSSGRSPDAHDPARGVRHLPGDVRHHHAGPHHRRLRRMGQFSTFRFHAACRRWFTPRWPMDLHAGWLGITDSGGINALDLRVARPFTLTRAAAPAAALPYANARIRQVPMEPHNVTYIVLGAASSGLAGSASTPAAPAPPPARPPTPSR